MSTKSRRASAIATIAAVAGLSACAALQDLVQPPIFDMAVDRTSEFRLLLPAADRPMGGAQIRVWAHVQNPNSVGFTLTRLTGNLLLEGDHAAAIDLPLGLPLPAAGDTVFPLDLNVSFADIPGLANQLLAAATGQRVDYAIRGILAVDAGPFGEPSFGPSTWLSGDLHLVR
jgi:hypothetical protein